MTTKMQLFLRASALGFVGLALLASELTLVGFKHRGLIARQPITVGTVQIPVQTLGKPRALQMNIQAAKRWADRIDAQRAMLMEASAMSPWQRWRKNVNIEMIKKQYSEDMVSHLKAMTAILKARREGGGFQKLREFDFQNMVRKSDYLLSLNVTKAILEFANQNEDFAKLFKEVLTHYNKERLHFDHKIVTVAEN